MLVSFLIALSININYSNAQTKRRHEYYWSSLLSANPQGGWNTKPNKISIKISGNKIIVKGKPLLIHKLDSGTDKNTKELKFRKRTYQITPKTSYYTLHWSSAYEINKKTALKALIKKEYGGFQVYFDGKKVIKLYLINGC